MPNDREREVALDRAAIHHRNARRDAEFALAARQNVEFYSKGESGLEAKVVEGRINSCRDRMGKYGRLESAALKLLNDSLLDAGHEPSDVAVIDGHHYGVANPGLLAVHLGRSLPTDDDLANLFEPMPGSRDDAAEVRDTFADATRAFWG